MARYRAIYYFIMTHLFTTAVSGDCWIGNRPDLDRPCLALQCAASASAGEGLCSSNVPLSGNRLSPSGRIHGCDRCGEVLPRFGA